MLRKIKVWMFCAAEASGLEAVWACKITYYPEAWQLSCSDNTILSSYP